MEDRRREVEEASNQFYAERAADHADALCSSLLGIDRLLEAAAQPSPRLYRLRAWANRAHRHSLNLVRLHPAYASPHFAWAEFACVDGTPPPRESREAIRAWCRAIGEPLRDRFGPIHICSAYRTEVHARYLGGANFGLHLYDLHPNAVAVDVIAARADAATVADAADDLADGVGRNTFFVHTDNRSRLGWPPARWSG